MRKFIAFGLFVAMFSLFITSCDKNDDRESFQLEKNGTTNGFWVLTNVRGGFAGVNQTYKPSVTWEFNTRESTLDIKNNDPKGIKFDVIKPGKYHYYIINHKGNSYLFINDFEFGLIKKGKNNTLSIDQNKIVSGTLSDGFFLTFSR